MFCRHVSSHARPVIDCVARYCYWIVSDQEKTIGQMKAVSLNHRAWQQI